MLWEGVDLLRARAIVVETPVFLWPQPSQTGDEGRAEREARALVQSAILTAAEHRPVINTPGSAFLAHSPAVALDELVAGGIPVVPWRLGPAPSQSSRPGTLVLDAVGRDRWHCPSVPPPGQPALIVDPAPAETWTVLALGGRIAAAEHAREDRTIPAGICADYCVPAGIPAAVAELAVRAARHLHLHLASVVAAAPDYSPAVVLVEAGPDLEWWNRCMEGTLASCLIDCLLEISE